MRISRFFKRRLAFIASARARMIILSLLLGSGMMTTLFFGNILQDNVDLDFDPNAQVYEGEEPPNIGGVETGVAIPGYAELHIPADTKDVNIAFLNPSSNATSEKTYYLTFDLTLKETGESLWKSGKIRPGYVVNTQTLKRELPAGKYEAVVKTQPYTHEGSTANSASMETTLIVK